MFIVNRGPSGVYNLLALSKKIIFTGINLKGRNALIFLEKPE